MPFRPVSGAMLVNAWFMRVGTTCPGSFSRWCAAAERVYTVVCFVGMTAFDERPRAAGSCDSYEVVNVIDGVHPRTSKLPRSYSKWGETRRITYLVINGASLAVGQCRGLEISEPGFFVAPPSLLHREGVFYHTDTVSIPSAGSFVAVWEALLFLASLLSDLPGAEVPTPNLV